MPRNRLTFFGLRTRPVNRPSRDIEVCIPRTLGSPSSRSAQSPHLLFRDSAQVIDTEDMSRCAAHDVAAQLVAAEPSPPEADNDEAEEEGLPPRAYRPSPTAIVRALVLRASPQLVQTAAAVYADGTANTSRLLLEPHVALSVGLAWRQLLPGPLAQGNPPTEPSESPVSRASSAKSPLVESAA